MCAVHMCESHVEPRVTHVFSFHSHRTPFLDQVLTRHYPLSFGDKVSRGVWDHQTSYNKTSPHIQAE